MALPLAPDEFREQIYCDGVGASGGRRRMLLQSRNHRAPCRTRYNEIRKNEMAKPAVVDNATVVSSYDGGINYCRATVCSGRSLSSSATILKHLASINFVGTYFLVSIVRRVFVPLMNYGTIIRTQSFRV